jgi:hypothetical protein
MAKIQKNGRCRLVVEMPEGLHQDIKVRATLRGSSITVWVLQAILEKLDREKQYE